MRLNRVRVWLSSLSIWWAAVVGHTWAGPIYPNPSASLGKLPEDDSIKQAARRIVEGKSDEALALIRDGARAHPEWPPSRLILAQLLFVANQGPQALRMLELAAADAPEDPRIYQGFGARALGEARFSDARLNFEKILTILEKGGPTADVVRSALHEAHAGLAAVAEACDQWGSAEAHLRTWLVDDPKNGVARQRLGRALYQLGKPGDAFLELKQAALDDPGLEPPAITMALLFDHAGDSGKAEGWFEYAQKASPKDARGLLTHARWLLDQGRAADARPLAVAAAKLDPASKAPVVLRGLIAWHLRDLVTAEQVFEGLHHDAPADASVTDLLARILIEQDDSAKRARALQLAELNALQAPKSPEALATLGWANYRLGHADLAERFLKASVAGGQASPDIAYFYARLLADRDRNDEARALLKSATSLSKGFAFKEDAVRLLASLETQGGASATRTEAGHPDPQKQP